jgi:UDP:flavonoid glycosyltransferase YjiC (YdhE family)
MLPAGYAPPNVLISSWVPQPAVLGHAAIKAFVSHGGQNSTNEGLTAGKPILCIPLGADQPINAQLLADKGFGIKVRERFSCSESYTIMYQRPTHSHVV